MALRANVKGKLVDIDLAGFSSALTAHCLRNSERLRVILKVVNILEVLAHQMDSQPWRWMRT